jgi:alkylglycerol monooxygenase
MKVDYIALSVPVFFILIGLELLWSFIKGVRLYSLSDAITNISCGIGQQLTGAFFKTFLLAGYIWIYENARIATIKLGFIQGILLFVGVDFCYYWFHRMSHEINAIWATHIVHHQSEEYNLTVALRQSWFQAFFSNLFYLPLAWIGFDPITTVAVIAFNTLYQFWIHTELIKNLGWFEWIFNTPSHHRVHHGSNPEYIDKNHGGTLIVWDRIFGTFKAEQVAPVYGITTPLRSWNPFQANFHYWKDLFRLSLKASRVTDKLKIFFAAPGWQPAELGGRQYPQEVKRSSFQKFDVKISNPEKGYAIVQFAAVLGFSSFLLFEIPLSGTSVLWPLIVWSLLSIGSIGAFLERRNWSWAAEILRLLFLIPAALLLPQKFDHLMLPFLGYSLVSIISFIVVKRLVITGEKHS